MDIEKKIDKLINSLVPTNKNDDILLKLKGLLSDLQSKKKTTWIKK